MSDESNGNDWRLITPARSLVPFTTVNSLVARGLADIARHTSPAGLTTAVKPSGSCEDAFLRLLFGNLDEAIQLLDEIIQFNPNHSFAHYLRGGAWFRKSRHGSDRQACDKAIGDFDHAIGLEPEFASAYEQRGLAWYCKNDYDNAIRDLNEAIRLLRTPEDNESQDEDDKRLDEGLRRSAYEVYYARGNAWARKSAYEKAIQDFDEAIRLLSLAEGDELHHELDHDVRRSTAEIYYCRGKGWACESEYDKAIQDFEAAIGLDPGVPLFYFSRANAWSEKQHYVKAIADYEEAIRLDPAQAVFFNNRGVAWGEQENNDKAIEDYNEAIRLDPSSAQYHHNRAVAWSSKAEYDKAISDYDTAIQLDPETVSHYFARGEAWCAKKDYGRAIKDFDEAIRRRKERLEKLRSLKAPQNILENELRMLNRLQDARKNASKALAE